MNNSISRYNAGQVNPYRQVDKRTDVPSGREAAGSAPADDARFGPDLSDAEAGMIDRQFPDSERMRLRLYGPGRSATSVDPGERGRRLDLRG